MEDLGHRVKGSSGSETGKGWGGEIDQFGLEAGIISLRFCRASKHAYDDAIVVARRICDLTPDDVLAHTSPKARVLDWKRQLKGEGSADSEP